MFAVFISPFDSEFLLNCPYRSLIVAEDNILKGGLGESVAAFLAQHRPDVRLKLLGYENYLEAYSREKCYEENGLTTENLNKLICDGENA